MRLVRHKKLDNLLRVKGLLIRLTLASILVAGCQISQNAAAPVKQGDFVSKGVTLLETGQYMAAYRFFLSTSPFTTNNPDTLSGLAISADLSSKTSTARKAYAALEKVASDKAYFYNNRGYSKMLHGDLQEAYADLIRANFLDPGNIKIQNNLRMLRNVLPR